MSLVWSREKSKGEDLKGRGFLSEGLEGYALRKDLTVGDCLLGF